MIINKYFNSIMYSGLRGVSLQNNKWLCDCHLAPLQGGQHSKKDKHGKRQTNKEDKDNKMPKIS